MPHDKLEGWEGEVQERRDICILMAGSCIPAAGSC